MYKNSINGQSRIYYRTAQSRMQILEYKLSCDIVRLFRQLVICTVKKHMFSQSAARATLFYPLGFSRLMKNEQKDLAEKKAVGQ